MLKMLKGKSGKQITLPEGRQIMQIFISAPSAFSISLLASNAVSKQILVILNYVDFIITPSILQKPP